MTYTAKQKGILEVLDEYGSGNAQQISGMYYRRFGERITKSQVVGSIRGLVDAGLVGKSNCGIGAMTYWIIRENS